MSEKPTKSGDRSLGMDQAITRRDFLGSTLLASGAQLLEPLSPAQLLSLQGAQTPASAAADWNGYGGVGEYANSNGNTWEVLSAGHRLRDVQPFDPKSAHDTGEIYDCVVIGGGISGLAAALFFLRQAGPNSRVLVLENHPIFGGEAKQNEFEVNGHRIVSHQGSAIYFVQYPHSFLAQFFDSIGLKQPRLSYQKWGGQGAPMTIGRTPYDAEGMATGQYGFWFGPSSRAATGGQWVIDPIGSKFSGAPVSEADQAELVRWYSGQADQHSTFIPPRYEGDDISRALDAISLEEHYMQRYGLSREFVRTYLPDLGGGSGLGADALSAYSEYAADLLHPYEKEGEAVQMFPGGNTTIARLLAKALIPEAIGGEASVEGVTRNTVNFAALDQPASRARIRLNATVLNVAHEGDPQKAETLQIVYMQNGSLFRVRAKSAVMAGGSWTTKHLISQRYKKTLTHNFSVHLA